MQTGSEITTLPSFNEGENLEDLLAALGPLDPVDIKKSEVAVNLASLLVCAKINRTTLAQKLNWKKSRITKVLSGESNSTIETLWHIVFAAGYDFDLVFRRPDEAKPAQPWEKASLLSHFEHVLPTQSEFAVRINIQTPHQVANDLWEGDACDYYVGFCHRDPTTVVPRTLESIEAPTRIPDSLMTKSTTLMIV